MRINRSIIEKIPLFIVPIGFFVLGLYIILFRHLLFEEFDGVANLFVGIEFFQGKGFVGWGSHYYGPLYPFLLGFFNLFLDGFFAGKLISLVSATILLIYAYRFTYFLTKNKAFPILVQIYIAAYPLFFIASIQVENNMLDSTLIVISFYYFVKSINQSKVKYIRLAGIFSSLAFLTRQTSIILPILFFFFYLIYIKNSEENHKIKSLTNFLISFLVISVPWLVYNTIKNGSPIASWQYLNLGYYLSGDPYWLEISQQDFNNLIDVVRAYYPNIIDRWLSNLNIIFFSTKDYVVPMFGGILGYLFIPTFINGFIKHRKRFLPYFCAFVVYITGISFFNFYEQLLLAWIILFSMESIIFMKDFNVLVVNQISNLEINFNLFDIIKNILFKNEKMMVEVSLILFSILPIGYGMYKTYNETSYYVANYEMEIHDAREIAETLKAYDENIQEKYIMAIHPAYAYYANSYFLVAPVFYSGLIEDYVNYGDIHEKVINYYLKFPANEGIYNFSADYLIYDRILKGYTPQFNFLFDTDSNEIPSNFKLIYHTKYAVVYEILK